MRNLIISGPTASGKSGAAMALAKSLGNAEIISADAFQVYKGLDIGTAKITLEERRQVKHHLIDIMEPEETYTAGLFTTHTENLINEIRSRGNIPIVVGGTGLYIKSLRDGIFDCPEIAPHIRIELHKRMETEGLSALYSELCSLDPKYASRISSNDPVRIVRALEVCIGLGITFTKAHEVYKKAPAHKYKVMVIVPDRACLYNDINRRTEHMWNLGWPEEVEHLLNSGVSENCPAFRAIGYKQAVSYIKNLCSKDDAVKEIAKQTRHFAKRQFTWFRGMDNIEYYPNGTELLKEAEKFCLSGGQK